LGYKSKEAQRRYQQQWIKDRRDGYFKDKVCAICGSKEKLELDHIDRLTKVGHKIWSWSKQRRDLELTKCQVLCEEHHSTKSAVESMNILRKLNATQVQEVRNDLVAGMTQVAVAKKFNVSRRTILSIWKNEMLYSKVA